MSRRGDSAERPTVREIEEDAAASNPDPHTRRETFELDLMEQHRSEEGRDVSLVDDVGEAAGSEAEAADER